MWPETATVGEFFHNNLRKKKRLRRWWVPVFRAVNRKAGTQRFEDRKFYKIRLSKKLSLGRKTRFLVSLTGFIVVKDRILNQ